VKSLLLSVLLTSTAAFAFAADTSSLSGKWQVHGAISDHELNQNCTFTQKDTDLTGNCISETRTVEISGKVDGKKVTWMYKSDYEGTPITVNFEGRLESETKITGTVSVPEYSAEGDFTATQSK
jgi:hypothetical protein